MVVAVIASGVVAKTVAAGTLAAAGTDDARNIVF